MLLAAAPAHGCRLANPSSRSEDRNRSPSEGRSDRGEQGAEPEQPTRDPIPETRFAVHGDRRNGIDRLSLVGELDRSTVPLLEVELYDVAHAGGAIVLDLRDLDAVDPAGVRALEATAEHAGKHGWWLFIVNCRDLVRDAFDGSTATDLLNEIDVSDVLAFGDGEWSPTSLPPLPGQRNRKNKRLRIVEDRS